jgi:transposase
MSDRFDHTLERPLEPKEDEPGDAGLVRRIELITGNGRRRRWSTDAKARVVLESLAPGANVSEVARRHGLSPQQLFGWRREARALLSTGSEAGAGPPVPAAPERVRRKREETSRATPYARPSACEPDFAPVVIAASSPPQAPAASAGDTSAGRIEIAIGDTVVRVGGQVEASLLTTVLCAVRRAS